jgi:ABC-2 type transport system permease protein
MRTFFVLFDRELRSFFNTPIAYVVMVFFLAVLGFQFHAGVMTVNNRPDIPVTALQVCFESMFWFPYMQCVSLISMRTFADEFRMGTLETLTTAPVRDWQVVLAKFAGVFTFYLVLLAPTTLYFVVLKHFNGGTASAAGMGAFGSAYLMLALIGMFYTAIGCLASSLVRDQINAAAVTFAFILVTFFITLFLTASLVVKSSAIRALAYFLCPYWHLHDACAGRVDTQQLVLYPSLTILVLFFTLQVFQYRKWQA